MGSRRRRRSDHVVGHPQQVLVLVQLTKQPVLPWTPLDAVDVRQDCGVVFQLIGTQEF